MIIIKFTEKIKYDRIKRVLGLAEECPKLKFIEAYDGPCFIGFYRQDAYEMVFTLFDSRILSNLMCDTWIHDIASGTLIFELDI
jgi:hypothetical protein